MTEDKAKAPAVALGDDAACVYPDRASDDRDDAVWDESCWA